MWDGANSWQEIYQRSLQVEPPTGGPSVSAKKKFPWFANK